MSACDQAGKQSEYGGSKSKSRGHSLRSRQRSARVCGPRLFAFGLRSKSSFTRLGSSTLPYQVCELERMVSSGKPSNERSFHAWNRRQPNCRPFSRPCSRPTPSGSTPTPCTGPTRPNQPATRSANLRDRGARRSCVSRPVERADLIGCAHRVPARPYRPLREWLFHPAKVGHEHSRG